MLKTNMKNYLRILGAIAFIAIFFMVYLLFFPGNDLILVFLVIGSVAVVSTSTIYTVIQREGSPEGRKTKKKLPLKSKAIKKRSKSIQKDIPLLFENYIETLPFLEDYAESDENYEKHPKVNDLIFTVFTQEELDKINLLGLSQSEKIQFLKEMLYFDKVERENLIENMLVSRGKIAENVVYIPPLKTIELGEIFRVYIVSLVETGEKRKILEIDTSELIRTVKERVGRLFNYDQEDFHLSYGGLILKEDLKIQDYPIEEEDEMVLIPSRKERK